MDEIEIEARALLKSLEVPRRRARPRVSRSLAGASEHEVAVSSGTIAAWRLGEGPAVLMIHGWEDDNALWGPLIDRFSAEARAVVSLDLPGHGFSEASDASPAGVGEAALAVADTLGPIEAVVGHSFGCMAALMALTKGLEARRCVMIATPIPRTQPRTRLRVEVEVAAEVYQRALAISLEGEEERTAKVEAAIRGMSIPCLVVHSADDDQTPVSNAYRLAELWPGAELMLVDEQGHRFVAQDRSVMERIVEFVEGYPTL